MGSYKFVTLLSVLTTLISGCSTTNVKIESDSFWAKETQSERKSVGVALAGGGTKASSFSMGVLSALSAKDQLWNIDAISTVSGGSYAGLFLYSRLIADNKKGKLSSENTKKYFQDCIPAFYKYGSS